MAEKKTQLTPSQKLRALNELLDEPDLDVESMDPAEVKKALAKDRIDVKASFERAQQTFKEARARADRANAREQLDHKKASVTEEIQKLKAGRRAGRAIDKSTLLGMFHGQHFRNLEGMTDEDFDSLLDDDQILKMLDDDDAGSGI